MGVFWGSKQEDFGGMGEGGGRCPLIKLIKNNNRNATPRQIKTTVNKPFKLAICRAHIKTPAAKHAGCVWRRLCVAFFSLLSLSPPVLSISLFFEPVGEGESGRLAATSTRGGTEGEARGPSASSGSKRGTNPRRCQQPATAAMGNLP